MSEDAQKPARKWTLKFDSRNEEGLIYTRGHYEPGPDIEYVDVIEYRAFESRQAEVSRLREELDGYKWFAERINEYVIPGELDSSDAAKKLFEKLQSQNEKMREAILALDEHFKTLGHKGLTEKPWQLLQLALASLDEGE